jgi:hypothetical protein
MFFRSLLLHLGKERVYAEYDRSVVGTVTDPTGSVVVNATVTLTNNATDDKRMTMVGETGDYQFL